MRHVLNTTEYRLQQSYKHLKTMFRPPSRIYKLYKLTFPSVQLEEQEEVLGGFAFCKNPTLRVNFKNISHTKTQKHFELVI